MVFGVRGGGDDDDEYLLAMALVMVMPAIFRGGSVDSPREAWSFRYRGLLVALAKEPPLYFYLFFVAV